MTHLIALCGPPAGENLAALGENYLGLALERNLGLLVGTLEQSTNEQNRTVGDLPAPDCEHRSCNTLVLNRDRRL